MYVYYHLTILLSICLIIYVSYYLSIFHNFQVSNILKNFPQIQEFFMLYFPKENKTFSFPRRFFLVCFSFRHFRYFQQSTSYIIVLILRMGWGCCYPWGRWIVWWYHMWSPPPPGCTPHPPYFFLLGGGVVVTHGVDGLVDYMSLRGRGSPPPRVVPLPPPFFCFI